MRYLIRAVKYFFYLLIILSLVISALIFFEVVDSDISTLFVNGYDSYWQIALLMAVFAAIYPRFGFSRRKAYMNGSDEELRPEVMSVMEDHGYRLESEDGADFVFVKRSPLSRALKMWEDRISFSRDISGYNLEGLTRDLPRLISALEYRNSNKA